MQQLCPQYRSVGSLDLLWVWNWKMALNSAIGVTDLVHHVIGIMLWIVQRRSMQFTLAQLATPYGYMGYSTYWQSNRVISPLDLCVGCKNVKLLREFSLMLWKCDQCRVVSSSVYSSEHETMCLRLNDEDIKLIILVDPDMIRCHLEDVTLIATGETVWCEFVVRERRWHMDRDIESWTKTPHRESLMAL